MPVTPMTTTMLFNDAQDDGDPLNPNVLPRRRFGDACDDCSSGTDAPNNDGTDN